MTPDPASEDGSPVSPSLTLTIAPDELAECSSHLRKRGAVPAHANVPVSVVLNALKAVTTGVTCRLGLVTSKWLCGHANSPQVTTKSFIPQAAVYASPTGLVCRARVH